MKKSLKTEEENISLKEQKEAFEKIVSFLEERKGEKIFEKIEVFHSKRIDELEKNDVSVPLRKGVKTVLHLIPFNSFVSPKNYDLSKFYGKYLELKPLRDSEYSQTYDFDGLIHFNKKIENESFGYVQLFTNGIIEAVSIRLFKSLEITNTINKITYMSLPIIVLEKQIVAKLKEYLLFLKEKLKVDLPIIFYLSLLEVEKCIILRPDPTFNFEDFEIEELHNFDIKILNFPKIIIDRFDIVPEKILKATFDRLWNAAGYPRSFHYNDAGEWIKK